MMAECPRCEGTGVVMFSTAGPQDERAIPDEEEKCSTCNGSGEIDTVEYQRDIATDYMVDSLREDPWW